MRIETVGNFFVGERTVTVEGEPLRPIEMSREARLAPVWEDYRTTGPQVDVMDLPSLGQHGNSHLIMADTNSDAVSSLIQEWIEKTLTERT